MAARAAQPARRTLTLVRYRRPPRAGNRGAKRRPRDSRTFDQNPERDERGRHGSSGHGAPGACTALEARTLPDAVDRDHGSGEAATRNTGTRFTRSSQDGWRL